MKNRIKRFFKKQWLLLWLLTAIIVFSVVVVYAVYPSTTNSMQRVVVSESGQGMMFSSNYLVVGGENSIQSKFFAEIIGADNKATQTYDVDVYIWNFDLDNSSKTYPEDIDYTVSLKMTNSKGEAIDDATMGVRTVVVENENGDVVATLRSGSLSANLNGLCLVHSDNDVDSDKFTLKYAGIWDLDNDQDICVQMIAKPDNGGDITKYKDLKNIGAVIGLKKISGSGSGGWQVYLNEERSGMNVNDCDAFNLVATGSGKATLEIEWDTTKVEFNEYFYGNGSRTSIYNYPEVSSTPAANDGTASGNWAKLTISADSSSATTSYRNIYNIQLYKNSSSVPADWSFFGEAGTWVKKTITITN